MVFDDSLMTTAAVLDEIDHHSPGVYSLIDGFIAGPAVWHEESILVVLGEDQKRVFQFFDSTDIKVRIVIGFESVGCRSHRE